jgi:hypothetical protein
MATPLTAPTALHCTAPADEQVAQWPNFTWVDRTHATLAGGYQHWGNATLADGSRRLEPNDLQPPERCAAANFSSSYDSAGDWADARCSLALPSMCEVAAQAEYDSFVARSSGGEFTWVTRTLAAADAEGVCRQQGGHLATYVSPVEQAEVEEHYIRQVGWLAGAGAGWLAVLMVHAASVIAMQLLPLPCSFCHCHAHIQL